MSGVFTAQEWFDKLEYFGGHCAYCLTKCESLTQDHIVPISASGRHVDENIVPACHSCNSRKNASSLLTYLGKQTDFLRSAQVARAE